MTTRSAPASSTLVELNNLVAGGEVLGPLVDMSNDGIVSNFQFDDTQLSPIKNVVITTDIGGKADIPAGSSKVCSGTVFISGKLTPCTASRPN